MLFNHLPYVAQKFNGRNIDEFDKFPTIHKYDGLVEVSHISYSGYQYQQTDGKWL